jgi:hypothetical protein
MANENPVYLCKQQFTVSNGISPVVIDELLHRAERDHRIPPGVVPTIEDNPIQDTKTYVWRWVAVTGLPEPRECRDAFYTHEWPGSVRLHRMSQTNIAGEQAPIHLVGMGSLSVRQAEQTALELLAAAQVVRTAQVLATGKPDCDE